MYKKTILLISSHTEMVLALKYSITCLLRLTSDSLIRLGKPPIMNSADTIKAIAVDSSSHCMGRHNRRLYCIYSIRQQVCLYNKKNNPLTSNKITSLVIDYADRKFIGTSKGVLCVFT